MTDATTEAAPAAAPDGATPSIAAPFSTSVIEGVVTNTQIHRALLTSEPFLEGRFTTNLLDRVGSAAFLAAEARA